MKRLLNNITESLADAAILEMGIDINRTAEHRAERLPIIIRLKRFFAGFSTTMADAALMEIGAAPATPAGKAKQARETLEENLIEVAFAEAADYEDIHEAIRREHFKADDLVHTDECQYGDNDVCYGH